MTCRSKLDNPSRGLVETTEDALFGGSLRLTQPRVGYRVNVDSLLLCHFAAHGRRPRSTLDLGAGVGVLALGLHFLGACSNFALVESDPGLAELARQNLVRAQLHADIRVVDLKRGLPRSLRGWADLVIVNPPYHTNTESRLPEQSPLKNARIGTVGVFLEAARAAASPRSRICVAYPSRSLQRLLCVAADHGLFAKRMRLVHRDRCSEARLALVEFQAKKPGGLRIEPCLFEWESGQRSRELKLIVAGSTSDRK